MASGEATVTVDKLSDQPKSSGSESSVQSGSDWESDMQFQSMALDRKLEAEENFATFMENNPDARAICSDFLKHILVFKPDDTIAEAKAYFTNFTDSKQLRHDSPCVEDDTKPELSSESVTAEAMGGDSTQVQ
mmetsp:Transcript_94384/g.131164  ORF Transcript_94384/g.131164 Transcript_94384/m.131164 type:complete len:133 (+) Transcript_94384:98-496(+)